MAYTSKLVFLKNPAVHTPELKDTMEPFQEKWLEKHTLNKNKQLYHYTDLTGLKGIFKERGLWLSHISTLNDPFELEYGQNLVTKELEQSIIEAKDDNLRQFFNSIKRNVKNFGEFSHKPFIACFCESGNLLSQWRAYANNGGGYSIGFDINDNSLITFDEENLEKGYKPVFRKIIYSKDKQLKLIREYIDIITTGFKKGLKDKASGNMDKKYHSEVMAIQATNIFFDMILSFKNSVFEEEQEWRLIHVALKYHKPEKYKFRERNDELIPYKQSYLFDKKNDNYTFPINTIYIGPSLDKKSQKSAIELYLIHSSTKENKIQLFKPARISINSAGYELKEIT